MSDKSTTKLLQILIAGAMVFTLAVLSRAHPLGNFTINHFARIEADRGEIRVRYVVDHAEIPAYQELQSIDENKDGEPSTGELDLYGNRIAVDLAAGLLIDVDGRPVPLGVSAKRVSLPTGMGGLATLRIEVDLAGSFSEDITRDHHVGFQDTNHANRVGWREVVAAAAEGITVFDSSAFSNSVTAELTSYPEDLLSRPLDERSAEFSFRSGPAPSGSTPLATREGEPLGNRLGNEGGSARTDRLSELISSPDLTPGIALFGLVIAAMLGSMHALSPGHGKTVVGAYLVGSRGTATHAAFLGLTVTITHTAGVFTLGLMTLFAAQYVVPERLFPILSLTSGAIVVVIGASLLLRRFRALVQPTRADHSHGHGAHNHDHSQGHGADPDAQGGSHSHLPPGADGSPVTWRRLLALGIAGGLLPCPSALVVLLSAISLHRVGYGLLLVVSFSIGLASVLTAVGLFFVYARRFLERPLGRTRGPWVPRLVKVVPVGSALVITGAGIAICYQALGSSGTISVLPALRAVLSNGWMMTTSILGLGCVLGLKHSIEADHLAAVSTIASETNSLLHSLMVGAQWGIGHTVSLMAAGVALVVLGVRIGGETAHWLEVGVAIMLLALGIDALRKLARGKPRRGALIRGKPRWRTRIHTHQHTHGGRRHAHPHLHESADEHRRSDLESRGPGERNHHRLALNPRPLIVGMVHGLAGSAALMILVLATTQSVALRLAYIAVFGVGSIAGMSIVSALVAVPLRLAGDHFVSLDKWLRATAGLFSIACGLMMVFAR